ncbi:MAG: putative Non-ribosomal peptide synthase [Burkholderiales bacterium]|nr:putative Non-ribosomal peptide synthase [Burkholderiales bacterium]
MLEYTNLTPISLDRAIESNNSQYSSIHELFQKQVINTPNNIAISFKNISITYQKLNNLANQLAHYLQNVSKVQHGDLIALYLNRNESMVIAILAVLKAGGAYVPIDTAAPKDRINYILEDTKAKIIITSEQLSTTLYRTQIRDYNILAIDNQELVQNYFTKQPISNPKVNTTSRDLAYVIYTSGTTGKPKGVLQLHGNVISLFSATEGLYKFSEHDVWTLFHSYIFDFSVWEIFGALLYGGKLVICPAELVKNTELFYTLCEREKVTILNQTPNVFYQFMDIDLNKPTKLDNLKYVIFGGDKLNFQRLKPWFDKYEPLKPELINMYGITETTIHVTYKKISNADISSTSCIGKFIPNMQGYILDNNLTPLPPGEIGELFIGGDRLARGYLNLPELTAERFITNPFQTEEEKIKNRNNRLYRTGDLVRYLANKDFEYIARNDAQIKIRGFRVELGEIESTLMAYSGIKQAVVLLKEHTNTIEVDMEGPKYLICYYISENKLVEKEIKSYLSNMLPEHMIPNIFIQIDKLPLTVNGKLDRIALLNYKIDQDSSYVAPRNQVEIELCDIWSTVLKIPVNNIGIYDDFFRLGGDSILAIKLINRINVKFKCQIKIVDIYTAKTLDKLIPLLKPNKFQLINNLNNTTDKLNIFMIHPAMAGSEVYVSLAQKLTAHYSCYGIDNYNLNSNNKISNLTDLAKFYLSNLDAIRQKTNQSKQPYLLLGWSFGGQIALEIASILEQRGVEQIWIVILDTVLIDKTLALYLTQAKEDLKKLYSYHQTRGYLENYTDKLINNFECEQNLVYQKISKKLYHSNILLFKATKYANEFIRNHEDINNHVAKLAFNNLDFYIKNPANIRVAHLENISHDDVCEQSSLICQTLCSWRTKS